MNIRRLILFAALSLPLIALGQAPDNKAIEQATLDRESPYYYPALMIRYIHGDTTLTLDEYRYLYYGFAYQPDYRPLEAVPAADRLMNVMAANARPDSTDAIEILRQAREVMKRDPFSPTNINFMTYAYGLLGDKEQAMYSADRLRKVVETIRGSGDGLTEKTAWHVLSFAHAADIMALMDLKTKKPIIVSSTVEYVPLLVRDGDVKGYYFNYGRAYWKKPDNLPEKRVDGFEINGIKVK
ncbi:MAG: DUF4919 domain-containing protein [Rikenellaceae bacterium]|nr:DUF4919 domain-containing protein [Rikenellaceae bacterium]